VSIVDILELVGKSEDAGDVGISLKVSRAPMGRRMRVLPGLLADVLQWNNPALVYLRNNAVREWAGRSKHAMLRTWAVSRTPESRAAALTLINNTFGEKGS